MRIKLPSLSSFHHVYENLAKKTAHGFRELGHSICDVSPYDLVLTFGSATSWDHIKDLNARKTILVCHGVNWARGGSENDETNIRMKSCWDNCDKIVYHSKWCKYMAEKMYGQKDGIIFLNGCIPDFPKEFQKWKQGEEIKIVCCSVWRAWKRLHEIERLIRLIASKGQKVKLYVFGQGPSMTGLGTYNFPLKGENYEIIYRGMTTHGIIKETCHQSHIGIHLAFNDNSPATVGELMGWGLPMIITNSGGSVDVVGDAGIILDTDPFVDTPMNIHNENCLPKVDDAKFEEGFWKLMNNLEEYQAKNKERVEKEVNITNQVKKLLESL